ncbi:MAG: hypothetical protein GKR89_26215 [Candidatus Latescibacteria bacterium]|nr:hypothetical protein [Candidatus Latescibacterota bacterium]
MDENRREELLHTKLRHRRNTPPDTGIRVPPQAMREFITALFIKAGTNSEDAQLLGQILTACDVRCVFSHGTQAAVGYLDKMRSGEVNPRPQVEVVHEAPGALVLDGDGGLGYLPCWRGTEQIITKAKTCGAAVLTTRNHFHFGAAGNYTWLAVGEGCIGLAASNHRNVRAPERPLAGTITSSPISIGVPATEQPPMVLDMGSGIVGFNAAQFADSFPAFFKSLGISNMVQILGGVVAGIYLEQCRQGPWTSNQGSFIAVFDTEHLMPSGQVQSQVDQYMREARAMQPLPGMERAELAGGFEWAWQQENETAGIPVGDKHRQALEEAAGEWGVEAPFAAFAETRF